MEINFKEIDISNYGECVELNVKEEQENFISPNYLSLLGVHYEDVEAHPMAIYQGENMIGFIKYVFYPADEDYSLDSWWIERFMIDKAYQNKGYGKESLKRFLDFFRKKYGNIEVRIGTAPENSAAISLYEKVGFEQTGEIAVGEVVLCLKL